IWFCETTKHQNPGVNKRTLRFTQRCEGCNQMSYHYSHPQPRVTLGEPPAAPVQQPAPQPAPAPLPLARLTGPTTIQRGTRGDYVVTNAPPGATFSNWRFTAGQTTVSRSGNNNFADWSGTMVQSGTIGVTMSAGGKLIVLSLPVTVTAR